MPCAGGDQRSAADRGPDPGGNRARPLTDGAPLAGDLLLQAAAEPRVAEAQRWCPAVSPLRGERIGRGGGFRQRLARDERGAVLVGQP